MPNLDWNIGKVSNVNDAVLTGAINDAAFAVNDTAEKVISILYPSLKTMFENTGQLIRSPIKTLGNGKNWIRGIKTLPVVGADVMMKSLRLPFAALDNAVEYVVNNNLERYVDMVKKNTTELVANIISDNGNSRFKLLRGIGAGVKGIGDGIGTILKAPTGGLGKVTGIVDNFLAQGTTATDKWVNDLKVSEANFIPRKHFDGVTNTASKPENANIQTQK